MRFLKNIANTLINADVANQDQIVLGRHNYYHELPKSVVIIDATSITPKAYYSNGLTDNVTKFFADITIEFIGDNGDLMEEIGELLGFPDRPRSHQYRPPRFMDRLDFFEQAGEFCFPCGKYPVFSPL